VDKKTIVVCASTGNQGKAVVESLLRSGNWRVIALTRDPESSRAQAIAKKGIELRKGDIENKSSLVEAFQGAYGVFGVTQPWSADYKKCNPEAEIKQGMNIVDACRETGISHLVLSTVLYFGDQATGIPHVDSKLEIEKYALQKKIPVTFLRPASFMDNIGMNFFPVKPGSVRGFVDQDAKVPYIACADIGEFAAKAFQDPEKYIGKGINLIGDFVSGEELCQTLSRLRKGERFRYKSVPKLLMRLFAKEFYRMRSFFEKSGRQPYPKEILNAIDDCRKSHSEILTIEKYLKKEGFETRKLT
jgi:uncharacterized protein YbjT (DUF2867 family)